MEYNYEDGYGHDVNEQGYDVSGIYRGQPIPKKKKKPKVTTTGGGSLIGLIIIIFIIIKVLKFLEKNWVSVVAILGIVILCITFCLIAKKKITKKSLATFLAIVISMSLITCVIYFGPMQNNGNFERLDFSLKNNTPTVIFKKYMDAFIKNDINTLIEYTIVTGNNVDDQLYSTYISKYIHDFDPSRIIEISEKIKKNNATLYVYYRGYGLNDKASRTFYMTKIKRKWKLLIQLS
jgi:hypothetical protein